MNEFLKTMIALCNRLNYKTGKVAETYCDIKKLYDEHIEEIKKAERVKLPIGNTDPLPFCGRVKEEYQKTIDECNKIFGQTQRNEPEKDKILKAEKAQFKEIMDSFGEAVVDLIRSQNKCGPEKDQLERAEKAKAKAELNKIIDQYVTIIKGLLKNYQEKTEREKPRCGGIVGKSNTESPFVESGEAVIPRANTKFKDQMNKEDYAYWEAIRRKESEKDQLERDEEAKNTGAMDFDFVLPSTFRPKLTDQEANDKLKKLHEKTKRKMRKILNNSDLSRVDTTISIEKKKK